MVAKQIPTLSTSGWLTDTAAKLDYELSCMVTTNTYQSNTYTGLSSIQSVIQQNKNNISAIVSELQNIIINKLSRVFENVNCEASYEIINPKESTVLSKITLNVNFTENGKPFSAGRVLSFYNGKFNSIAEANNG